MLLDFLWIFAKSCIIRIISNSSYCCVKCEKSVILAEFLVNLAFCYEFNVNVDFILIISESSVFLGKLLKINVF